MSYIRRQWLLIVRKSYHSVCLFLLAFFFSLFSLVGAYFGNIVTCYRTLIVQDMGYLLQLWRTDEESIPNTVLDEIAAMQGVSHINMEYSSLAAPIDFQNKVPDWQNDSFDQLKRDQVRLVGNLSIDANIAYQNHCRLTAGQAPTETVHGAVILDELAEYNGLALGDTITLVVNGGDETIIPIIGIYEMTSPIEENVVSDNGYEVYGASPYSYIFCDLGTYEAASGFTLQSNTVQIYSDSERALDEAYRELLSAGYTDHPYSLSRATEDESEGFGVTAQTVIKLADLMTTISSAMTVISLCLLIFLWMRNNYKDAAILISLGSHKLRIIADYFVLVTILISAALLVACPLFSVVISQFGETMIDYGFSVINNASSTETYGLIERAMMEQLRLGDYIRFCISFLGIAWMSTAAASVEIIRCNPRVLFMTE